MAKTVRTDQLSSEFGIRVDGPLSLGISGFQLKLTARNATPINANRTAFFATGADQFWQVPPNVYYIYAKLWGAGGAGGNSGGWTRGSMGGGGGHSVGIIPVTPQEQLILVVGLAGQTNYGSSQTPRYGGGGGLYNNSDNRYCGSGGGYTGIFRTSISQANALLIAGVGGGGGSGSSRDYGNWGGAGGGTTGQAGNCAYDARSPALTGRPGTQSAGGTGGTGLGGNANAQNGAALTGGYGGGNNAYGGAGGGGYYGGGGGAFDNANNMAGGGGGSGFIGSTVLHGETFCGAGWLPAMYDDPDLPGGQGDAYSPWQKYAWGGESVVVGSQYTSTGGGPGYAVIYY